VSAAITERRTAQGARKTKTEKKRERSALSENRGGGRGRGACPKRRTARTGIEIEAEQRKAEGGSRTGLCWKGGGADSVGSG